MLERLQAFLNEQVEFRFNFAGSGTNEAHPARVLEIDEDRGIALIQVRFKQRSKVELDVPIHEITIADPLPAAAAA